MTAIARTTLSIEGAVGLRDAGNICQRLAAALAEFDQIEIDASGITSIDISIIQLLISMRKSAERKGKKLLIAAGATGTFEKVLAQAGVLGRGGVSRSTDEDFWLGGQNVERCAA
jgi:anti-anti-sigma regulatory factor